MSATVGALVNTHTTAATHTQEEHTMSTITYTPARIVTQSESRPGDCPSWCDVYLDGGTHEQHDGHNVRHVGRLSTFHPTREDDVRVSASASHCEDRNDFDGQKNHGVSEVSLEVRDGDRITTAALTAGEARFLAAILTDLARLLDGPLGGHDYWGVPTEVHETVGERQQRGA